MVPRSVTYFKFEGGQELERNLKEMADAAGSGRTGKAAMRRAGVKALDPFVQEVRSSAPVLSGDLSKSFHAGTQLTPRQRRLVRKEPRSGMEVYAGTRDPVGMWQEFGTAHHPAQPYARDAWGRTQGVVVARFAKEAWAELAKAAKRLAKRLAKAR